MLKSLMTVLSVTILLSGCASSVSSPTSAQDNEVTATATAEPTPEGLTIEEGCQAFSSKLSRTTSLLELLIDAQLDGDSPAYLAGDFKDVGNDLTELAQDVSDSDLRDGLSRWGDALIGISRKLAADEDTEVAFQELQLASTELESLCPNL
jgi:hypothetical protein